MQNSDILIGAFDQKGYRMVPFNFKVLAKFGLCSNCSQKLHGCSLARARKNFATARILLTCFKNNLTSARARKNKHTARMLANARKDHSIPLSDVRNSGPNTLPNY